MGRSTILLSTLVICLLASLANGALPPVRSWPVTTPFHRNFTIEDGLASNTVIRIYNDARGLMWIGTDQGLCSFDGSEFKRYSTASMKNTSVLLIDEDRYGNIWIATLDYRIYRVEGDELIPHKNLSHLEGIVTVFAYQELTEFAVVDESEIYLGSRAGSAALDETGYTDLGEETDHLPCSFVKKAGTYFSAGDCRPGRCDSVLFLRESDTLTLPVLGSDRRMQKGLYSETYLTYEGDRLAITTDEKLQVAKDDKTRVFDLEGTTTHSITFLDDGSVLVGSEPSGVFHLDEKGVRSQYFDGRSIISSCSDQEGGLWFGTLNSGLIYVPNLLLKEELKLDGDERLLGMYADENGIKYFTDSYQFFMNGKALTSPLFDKDKVVKHIDEVMVDSTHSVITVREEGKVHGRMVIDWKDFHVRTVLSDRSVISLLVMGSDTLYGTFSNIMINNKDGGEFFEYKRNKGMVADKSAENTFYVAGAQGVKRVLYLPDERSMVTLDTFNTQETFNQIFYLDRTLIAAAPGKPLMWLDEESNTFITDQDWEPVDVYAVESLNGFTLIGTSHGMFKLHRTAEGRLNLVDLGSTLGLNFRGVKFIDCDRDEVYMGLQDRILRAPKSLFEIEQSHSLITFIDAILINDISTTPENESYSFMTSDVVNILFKTIGYREQGDRSFSYRLFPLDSTWNTIKNAQLTLYNIPAGEYSLEVRSQNGSIRSHRLEAVAPLIEKPWFITVLTLIAVALVVAPFLFQRKLRLERLRAESELNAHKVKALTAQLSPHFVFNALSSIQSYILKKDPRSSNDFLVRFSRHIRRALEQSQADHITLGQALDTAVDYLELERMRLDGSFDYTVNVSEGIDVSSIKLPVLLLQPYVENAVIHGITDLDRPGQISITVSQTSENSLTVKVEDNGQGFSPARSARTKGHGLGTSINSERMDLLNTMGRDKYSVTSCTSEAGEGYCVTITVKLSHVAA